MNTTEAKKLWDDVRANGATWDACDGPHDLVDITPDVKFGKRYKCNKCGGTCDAVAKLYYEQGLSHGRKVTP